MIQRFVHFHLQIDKQISIQSINLTFKFCLHFYIVQNQFNYYSQPIVGNITNYELPQYEQQQQEECVPSMPTQQIASIFEQAISLVEQSQIANNSESIAEIDAFIQSKAEDLDDDTSSFSGSSFSCFSPHSEISSSTTDDSDWTASTSSSPNHSIGAVGAALKSKQSQKRKPRLNRRSNEDRQSRKKEQNKNAANRYRLKKKAEIEILADEERDLLKINESLKTRLGDVNREVKCLRNLLRELFRGKGWI